MSKTHKFNFLINPIAGHHVSVKAILGIVSIICEHLFRMQAYYLMVFIGLINVHKGYVVLLSLFYVHKLMYIKEVLMEFINIWMKINNNDSTVTYKYYKYKKCKH